MIESVPPGIPFLLGAALVPLLRGRGRVAWMLAIPVLGIIQLAMLPESTWSLRFLDYDLVPVRVDRLARVFGYIFHIAALLGVIYSAHVRDTVQQVSALVYIGAAIGAVFAGDLLTLFVYWELTAIASVFLVWASRTKRSYRAGMRYLLIQIGSGVLLLAGLLLHLRDTGSLSFGRLELGSTGTILIFLAFGVKCAFPFLHNWMIDAYPEATVTGTVFLGTFTTKLAVYALARSFAGTEPLIWIGAAMAAFPIFYAVIENDLRRVLCYSLNNQLGFMVVGIGIGTELSLNGTAVHAFGHILYKSLLFMTMGAVLYRTGTTKGSELGGLHRSMPWTTAFCIIGGMSSFPLFCGFVGKSMIVSAAADHGYVATWFLLLFGAAGVFYVSGIKLPFLAFFARDSGIRCSEAPLHMLLAMGATALLCVGVGSFPGPLFELLPYPVDYQPYSASHVVAQLQLLFFSVLAFSVLMRTGLQAKETPSVNLDFDWTYRRAAPAITAALQSGLSQAGSTWREFSRRNLDGFLSRVYRHYGPAGVFARTWAIGSSVLWVTLLLGIVLVLYYA